MIEGVSLLASEVPENLVRRYALNSRQVTRGQSGNVEYQFRYKQAPRELPIWWDGQLQVLLQHNNNSDEEPTRRTTWRVRQGVVVVR